VFLIHAEIWPGVVEQQVQDLVNDEPDLIRDRAQVRAMCEWAATKDAENSLGEYFSRPNDLTDEQVEICVQHEGWILGTP
jgi:hypothetical protein